MACESVEFWQSAKNATNQCPHPALVHCLECRAGICSAHIIECDECNLFVCSDCAGEHMANHVRAERQLLRAS